MQTKAGFYRLGVWMVLLGLLLSACGAEAPAQTGGRLRVVATTTIVGDVVRQVGGEEIELLVLIPAGVDEHAYEPAPREIAQVAEAGLVFENGAGLETFLGKLMENAGGKARRVSVSEGITLQEGTAHVEEEHAGEATEAEEHAEDEHEGDPHVWTDPNNVLIWVDNIEAALREARPDRAETFQQNADAYRQKLKELDGWVQEQVNQLPQERRKLVTDHLVFTYFAERYGFEQVGAIVPGYSTLAAPSAQELAALEEAVRRLGTPAIFVGNTVNPSLAERVANDTNTRLVPIMTGSLSGPDGPAPTYIDYVRYNVSTIVEALK